MAAAPARRCLPLLIIEQIRTGNPLKAGCAPQRQTGAMLQLCLTRPPPAEAGGGHAGVISAGELDRLGLLLRGPAEAAAGASAPELDGSPMDVSPTPFQGALLG